MSDNEAVAALLDQIAVRREVITALLDQVAVRREDIDMVITTAIPENNGVVDIPQAARSVVEIQLHGIIGHGQDLHDACLAWVKAAQAPDHRGSGGPWSGAKGQRALID